jgi:sRNA-binding carbon storage regulator CsrA
MYVLSRGLGEAVVIEDRLITVTRIESDSIEITLDSKWPGGATSLVMRLNEMQLIAPGVRLVFLKHLASRSTVRLGIEVPADVRVARKETWNAMGRGG